MIKGRFGDTTGSPYVEAMLIFPRLNLRGNISFLVDTGARRSLINPTDARRLQLYASGSLRGVEPIYGMAGKTMDAFVEEGLVVFDAREKLVVYKIELLVAPESADQGRRALGFETRGNAPPRQRLPSILGRDIINRWHMTYAPGRKRYRLWFRVVSADEEIPIP